MSFSEEKVQHFPTESPPYIETKIISSIILRFN